MKVEVLYLADCPFRSPAVKLLNHVLAAEGITAEVKEVLVVDEAMASELQFRGSPTVRINGRDVAGESSDTGTLACRLYPGSQKAGVPPVEILRRAVAQALERKTP